MRPCSLFIVFKSFINLLFFKIELNGFFIIKDTRLDMYMCRQKNSHKKCSCVDDEALLKSVVLLIKKVTLIFHESRESNSLLIERRELKCRWDNKPWQ